MCKDVQCNFKLPKKKLKNQKQKKYYSKYKEFAKFDC